MDWQLPVRHKSSPPQALPQAPQFDLSLCMSTQSIFLARELQQDARFGCVASTGPGTAMQAWRFWDQTRSTRYPSTRTSGYFHDQMSATSPSEPPNKPAP